MQPTKTASAKAAARERQVHLDLQEGPSTLHGNDVTTTKMAEKLARAINDIRDDSSSPTMIKAITKLPTGGLLVEFDSSQSAKGTQKGGGRERFPPPSSTPRSAPSGSSVGRPLPTTVIPSRKRPRQFVEDDDEEEEEAEPAEPAGTVQHPTPCAMCMAIKIPCRGLPGRTCHRCSRLKVICNKSAGRGGKKGGKVVEEAEEKEKAEENPPARQTRATERQPMLKSIQDSDVEMVTPKGKGKEKGSFVNREYEELNATITEAEGAVQSARGLVRKAEQRLDDVMGLLADLRARVIDP